MDIFYFAHNGVDHATHVEASAHNSNTILWIAAATLAVAAVVYTIARSLASSNARPQEQEEEE